MARAGIPIGILVKRYIRYKYSIDVPHYSISIIRGRGIDDNAMKFLLGKYRPEQLLFVDGWIGKGAILNELKKDIEAYCCNSRSRQCNRVMWNTRGYSYSKLLFK